MNRTESLTVALRHASLCARLVEAVYRGVDEIHDIAIDLDARFRNLSIGHVRAAAFILPERTIIAIAGTDDGYDWVANLGADQVPVGLHYLAHHGAVENWYLLRQNVKRIKREIGANPIVFTGHSAGGAVAELAAIEDIWNNETSLITFGSPRVLDPKSAIKAGITVQNRARYVYGKDPVPLLPVRKFRWLFQRSSYAHCGHEIHLGEDGAITTDRSRYAMLRAAWWSIWSGRLPCGLKDHEIAAYRQGLMMALVNETA